jgi:hypothetical protein
MKKDSKKLLFENMVKLNPELKIHEAFKNWTIDNPETAEYDRAYLVKVGNIKNAIDRLLQENEYEVIDVLYSLLVEKKAKAFKSQSTPALSENQQKLINSLLEL